MGRRAFLGTTTGVALSAAATSSGRSRSSRSTGKKLPVALVGTGIRGSGTWGKNLIEQYGDVVEMVGLCDVNVKRMAYAKGYMGAACPTFVDFDRMVELTRPEIVIVTTTDCYHAKYIRRAMELGCDVITEKPVVTDESMCQDVLDTERRTGRKLMVAFNYRFSPETVRIKEILNSGEIGKVTSVDFNYFLDVYHGASYFRRWHA